MNITFSYISYEFILERHVARCDQRYADSDVDVEGSGSQGVPEMPSGSGSSPGPVPIYVDDEVAVVTSPVKNADADKDVSAKHKKVGWLVHVL